MDLRELVLRKDDALTPDECDWVLEWFHSSSDYYEDGREQRVCRDGEIPSSDPRFQLLDASYFKLSCEFLDKFPEALNLYDSQSRFYNDGFLVTQYKAGEGFFREHVDARYGVLNSRQFATIWYLNNVEDGGETRFPLIGLSESPRKGSAIHFPCNWMFPHLGEIPESNDKYIVTTFTYAHPYNPQDASKY